MKVRYGIAVFDRWRAMMECTHLHMDGVADGGFIEFMKSAGEAGWELCGTFPSGVTGQNVAQPGKAELHKTTEPTEYITFIFKKV